ncbi:MULTISPECIES: hypothetical protein [Nostocales]|uniref:Uncharacterized protein n=3 Tax=Nostocales TaxID=1161 RepID=A0A0C1RC43_9CYAN|nr:hypothetical protein [Tolypothrix bouteillei]KAF3887827.1 hypothetical protein DA73_0400021780 [Tolypothrix bouteillei VB521301]
MKAAKLILLASPMFVSSMFLVANQAEAAIVPSALNQSDSEVVVYNTTQESNPILDGLGCKCSSCTQTRQEFLQGKLPSVR